MSFFLRFFSNYFKSGMGFQIMYESSNVFQGMIDKFEECGGGYYSGNGTIASPNYPGNYPNGSECIYTIYQPVGNVILLNFLDIEIDSYSLEPNCHSEWPMYKDVIEIRDGPALNSPVLRYVCGTEIPAPVQSSQNHLRLKWVYIPEWEFIINLWFLYQGIIDSDFVYNLKLFFRFASDSEITGKGFLIEYSAIQN